MDLPQEIVATLAPFAPLFAERTWGKAQALAVGAILAPGRRTVASALRVMGLAGERHFTNYHRVLNRDAWSALAAGRVLLGLILALLPADAPLVLAADDTVERRNGRKIAAKGCYRDPVRSSVRHPVRCFGLRWVVTAALVPMPWGGRPWALPLLAALTRPAGKGPRRGHKSSIDWARQMALQVRRWAPDRTILLVVDGGFAAVALAAACRRHGITLVSRLKVNAALYDRPAVPPPGRRGRKPKLGPRQPSPGRRASRPDAAWEPVEVAWYGGRPKTLRVIAGAGLWHAPRVGPVAIGYAVARDPEGRHRDAAYFSTDEAMPPARMLGYIVQRWSLEVTFEEARAHLGVETQRQWSDRAIARTTPVLFGLYSVVCLLAMRRHAAGELEVRDSAWYAKAAPTFSDCLASARRAIWLRRINRGSTTEADPREIPGPIWDALIQSLCGAA